MRTVPHYDAYGNLILHHAAMIQYYQTDRDSTRILKDRMPHQYYVLPHVTIRIFTGPNPHMVVFRVYPGGTKENSYDLTKRSLEALRATYRGRTGWKVTHSSKSFVELYHAGRVLPLPYRKF